MVTIRDAFPGFSVDDIGAAREFYGTRLGLPVDDFVKIYAYSFHIWHKKVKWLRK